MRGLRTTAVVLALALALPVFAVQPDEVLDDPALESRARDISAGLRCLVCQNESIDESNASLARDLRLLVRERLLAGDTNDEVVDFIVNRYGEFVLLQPTTGGWNWLLWASGPGLFLIAVGVGIGYVRRRSQEPAIPDLALSADEQKRLAELMQDEGGKG
jgi:cytochrome c-type biogenesis protein CcmH